MIFIPQHDQMDCGPACLAMIAQMHGKEYSLQYLKENSFISREGVSLLELSDTAKNIGFETFSAKLTVEELKQMHLPCILHWNQNHYVILTKISKSILSKKTLFKIIDPAHGTIILEDDKFKLSWLSDNIKGIALFLKPTEKFYNLNPTPKSKLSTKHLFNYLKPYKRQLSTMFLMLLFGSIITLIFPFLTQNLIDKGVRARNLDTITVILLAQLSLFFGSITIEIIRNWIMLYIGTKINITIISDFLKKILRLPIKFTDSKTIGDFTQRIQDHERIENFLTSQSLLTFFSLITFSVFFGILWYYDFKILIVYAILTIFAIAWSYYFLRRRKILDYFKFQQRGENQESIYEIFNGMTEMKLNQLEDFKRKEWEKTQHKLFKTNIRILKLNQFQLSGFEFLNQIKNILVTFLAATYVVKGTMTLGELLSVSYIIGEMNSPVNQLVNFFRSLQDAKLSLERLNEVQSHPEEEQEGYKKLSNKEIVSQNGTEKAIKFDQVSFQYGGPRSLFVLKDISISIPKGKITAIVGASGSGKTTLIKLLLKFYEPTQGKVFINGENLENISPKNLRENCGIVMQDGFIFSDIIERNIATGDEVINKEKLRAAARIANIEDFIESLPLGYNTKIGASGIEISGGQKQRLLIARAVYKNPQYILLDEATSALDAENEWIIHNNLQEFFKGKTVIVIAHRLSTVKNADQIIVLNKGEIVETGTHTELSQNKNHYYNLVKNQLELG